MEVRSERKSEEASSQKSCTNEAVSNHIKKELEWQDIGDLRTSTCTLLSGRNGQVGQAKLESGGVVGYTRIMSGTSADIIQAGQINERYWVNDRHWAGQDRPVFLHLGGEGSLGPGSVMTGHPAALAPAWGALIIGLEHRFYGLSVPAGGLGLAQLRYLSSRHAPTGLGTHVVRRAGQALRAQSSERCCSQVVRHSLGQRCLSFSRARTVNQLRASAPPESGVGDRQWLYQTCTEFGFYVTCEDPGCPFSQLPALASHLELCEQVFGLSASSVARAVAQTNAYYGAQAPGASGVLFVNGDTDPWQVLSVTRPSGPSEAALLIPGASHCADMAPERPSDPASLRQGRRSILRQLQAWLGQAQEERQVGVPA
ncbi:Thymus-specific serine protease [Heterocephalus glaber]|uniref:Thymus-specific serine protease n=1 Tax=Heterocephalus glaber TaxID=10181 RepID=G5BSF1_HETGA|nr:Thymus-specific serine protease [Heterocephalus glaber]